MAALSFDRSSFVTLGRNRVTSIDIRGARAGDADSLGVLARELLDFETGGDERAGSVLDFLVGPGGAFRDNLFGPKATGAAIVADAGGGELVGFATVAPLYSIFLPKPALLMEGLFVRDQWRRLGVGRRLLAAVARAAAQRGAFLEWRVARANDLANHFYDSLGAQKIEQFRAYRLEGDALERIAAASPINRQSSPPRPGARARDRD